jgi:hypothetical protein
MCLRYEKAVGAIKKELLKATRGHINWFKKANRNCLTKTRKKVLPSKLSETFKS